MREMAIDSASRATTMVCTTRISCLRFSTHISSKRLQCARARACACVYACMSMRALCDLPVFVPVTACAHVHFHIYLRIVALARGFAWSQSELAENLERRRLANVTEGLGRWAGALPHMETETD